MEAKLIILAEKVIILGTVRCTNVDLFDNIGQWLNSTISSLAKTCGAECVIKFRKITPPVNNNLEINRVLRESAINLFGHNNVIELQKPSMGAEDFAEFLDYVPGSMFRLGVTKNDNFSPLHSAEFNPDEVAIRVAVKLITDTIIRLDNAKDNNAVKK